MDSNLSVIPRNDPFNNLLPKLSGVKRTSNGFEAKCPAHDDRKASLSISGKEGKVLLYCHAGCSVNQICEALGMKVGDLFESPRACASSASASSKRDKPRIVATYKYMDEYGNPLYYKERDELKSFRYYRLIRGKKEYGRGDVSHVLYLLPLLVAGVKAEETIFIVEGEKDADNLFKLDFFATTDDAGASRAGENQKWRSEFNQYFKGAAVVILPDKDEPGRARGKYIAAQLKGVAKSIKLIELPGNDNAGVIKDVSDWISAGGTKEALDELVDQSPEYGSVASKMFLPLDFSLCEAMDFIVKPYIPRRAVTIIQAVTGAGKSIAVGSIAGMISHGCRDHAIWGTIEPGKILYYNTEDDFRTVFLPRMIANGFRRENLFAFDWFKNQVKFFDPAIEAALQEVRPDLVVFDVLKDLMPAGKNINDSGDVRLVINYLKTLAEKYNCAAILVTHIGKSGAMEGVYRSQGSSDWGSGARSILEISEDKESGVRNLHHKKLNGFMKGTGIGFTLQNKGIGTHPSGKNITAPFVVWRDESLTSDEVDEKYNSFQSKTTASKTEKAQEICARVLKDGPVKVAVFDKAFKGLAIGDKTIQRAKKDLGILTTFSKRDGYMVHYRDDKIV